MDADTASIAAAADSPDKCPTMTNRIDIALSLSSDGIRLGLFIGWPSMRLLARGQLITDL